MAFNSAPGRAEYTAIATQTAFPFTFKIYLDGDIKVYQTLAGATPDDTADLLTLTTDYTVSISGDNGGTITLVTGAAVGDTITLVRDLSIDRLIEYQNNGDLLAETLNQDQNYQTYLIADKDAENTRFLRLPNSSQNVSSELPAPLSLNFLQWNTTANALINANSLQADGFIWTATDVYTKTEANTLLDAKANLSGAAFTGTVSFAKGADVASATALPILTDGNYFDVTGTTTITSINTTGAVGTAIVLHFDGILTLTHHATDLILPGGANITTAAGDEAVFREYAAGKFICAPYTRASGEALVTIVNTGVLSTDDFLHIQDQKTNGTAGGSSIAGSQTRVLNTVLTNTISGASLATNQITLPIGTYYIEASSPNYYGNYHKLSLRNVTDTADLLIGNNANTNSTYAGHNNSSIFGVITLAASKILDVRHYIQTARATDGLGVAISSGQIEVYTDIRIWKVG